MREPGVAEVHRRTHRRELLPVGGPEKRAAPIEPGTHGPHLYWVGLAFEARGKKAPQAIEAGPLPDTCRANGGRCCPHLKSFLPMTPAWPGSTISSPVRSGGAGTSRGTGGLVS